MIGDPANLLTVTWQVMRDAGPDAYVLEFTDGQLALTFGPMPKEVSLAFIAQRKKSVADVFDRVVRKLNDGQNSSQENEQVSGQALS